MEEPEKSRGAQIGRVFRSNAQRLAKGAFFLGTWPTRKLEEGLDYIYGYDAEAKQNPPVDTRVLSIFITVLVIATGVTWYMLQIPDYSREASFMAGIFTLACLLWVTEALPLFATAILIIGLEIILIANPGGWAGFGPESGDPVDFKRFLEPLSDPIIVLFFGGFLLARAAVKRGVDSSLAGVVLRLFGNSPPRLMFGMMAITAFFSMWMSNTATATMMLTLLIPMFSQLKTELRFQKGLLLAIPFAANIGGMGTPISSPPNAVAVAYLHTQGISVSFLEWVFIAFPLLIIILFFAWYLLYRFYKPTDETIRINIPSSPVDAKGKYVIFIFMVTILLWLSEGWHGLPTAVVALIPAIGFTATGLLNKKEINSLEWNILILIAGGIALGRGMAMTGLDAIIVSFLPADSPLIFAILIGSTWILSTFISNTATSNLLIPLGVSLAYIGAGVMDVGMAREIAIGIALAASMAMALPVSTAPNTIAYAQGRLESKDFVLAGSMIGFVAIVLIIAFGPWVIQFWTGVF
jgi:solute carrier family 13 (sodium-dependent dicarboxylate transporter), member 2/3/5